MYEEQNPDILTFESDESTDSKLPHSTTPAKSTLICSSKSLRSFEYVPKSELSELFLSKTFKSADASPSTNQISDEVQNLESSEKYAYIAVDEQSMNIDVSNPSVIFGPIRKGKHEKFVPPLTIQKFREDIKSRKVPLRISSLPGFQLEGKEKKEGRKTFQSSTILKEKSLFFSSPSKRESTPNQFSSLSIPLDKRNLPRTVQKQPFSLQQMKPQRASNTIVETFDNETKKADPQLSLIGRSAMHPFGINHSDISCQGDNNAAHRTNTLTAAKSNVLCQSHNVCYPRAEYPRVLMPEAQRYAQRASTSYPLRSRYINSQRTQRPKGGVPEVLRFNLPRASESYSLGASCFHNSNHRGKIPRGGASEIRHNSQRASGSCTTSLRNAHTGYQGADIVRGGIVHNTLNVLLPRSYASVATSNIFWNTPNNRETFVETKQYQLDPSFISLLPEEIFEKVCRERIICESGGYYYIIFKVNSKCTNRHKREYHIKYIARKPLDDGISTTECDYNFTEVIKWLESLPSPEKMDTIR